ncbi:UNVERIFIED_CONTAM: hypothetical protein RMT77_002060 [Armadillidium vulgare]
MENDNFLFTNINNENQILTMKICPPMVTAVIEPEQINTEKDSSEYLSSQFNKNKNYDKFLMGSEIFDWMRDSAKEFFFENRDQNINYHGELDLEIISSNFQSKSRCTNSINRAFINYSNDEFSNSCKLLKKSTDIPSKKDTTNTSKDEKKSHTDIKSFNCTILQCFEKWKKNYPWAVLHEDCRILSCKICSESDNKVLIISQINCPTDMFQVAKHLRSHGTSHPHNFLANFSNFDVFQKTYFLLKDISRALHSKNLLYETITNTIKDYTGNTINEDTIDFLIKITASTIREYILKEIKTCRYRGISFAFDSRRKILIIKYCNEQNNPCESIIINLSEDDSDIFWQNFVSINDFSPVCLTFLKEKLGVNILPSRKTENIYEETLPMLLPDIEELFFWIRKNDKIAAYENFINHLSLLYKRSPSAFESIDQNCILRSASWQNFHTYKFICNNFKSLQNILGNNFNDDWSTSVHICRKYILDSNPLFSEIMNAISLIVKYNNDFYYQTENLTYYRSKLKEFLCIFAERLKNNENLYPFQNTIHFIVLYLSEILNIIYYNGCKNINDFCFLYKSQRLTSLGDMKRVSMPDRIRLNRVWILLQNFITVPKESFQSRLSYFGNYIQKRFNISGFTLIRILEIFNDNRDMKNLFPDIEKFYVAFSSLPICKAKNPKSFFNISALKIDLCRTFENHLVNELLTIKSEGPNNEGDEVEILHKLIINKIQKSCSSGS